MTSISYQLYSSRNWERDEALAMIAELGIREVEGFGPYIDNPSETQSALKANGLSMPTAHVGLAILESSPNKVLEAASKIGIQQVFAPYLAPAERPISPTEWAAFAQKLAGIAEPYLDAGLGFGWHNHEFEFQALEDGGFPIERIADADARIGLELDLAWIAVAEQDPLEWLERYQGRVLAAHVKDIAAEGEAADEDGWADVGHGMLDWSALSAKLAETGVSRLVLEHDNPSDHRRFAARSFATVSAFWS